ncbi:MAG TPA: hypothetical protein VK503_09755 [Candidatus Bathyarchaeia archaeon]|nr:hypothetical protein [Candidatus Bathyarchaeia archaeon]
MVVTRADPFTLNLTSNLWEIMAEFQKYAPSYRDRISALPTIK